MRYLVFLVLLCLMNPLTSQNWELRKSSEGIKIYSRDAKASTFDAFKAVMEVDGSIDDMNHILHNLDQYKHIFPDTKELKILERNGDRSLIQYTYNEAPWPADDRDGIYQMEFNINPNLGYLETKGEALPEYLPEKENVVRITESIAYWRVQTIAPNRIRVEYEVEAQPGGNIPDWLVNSAITEIPYKTFVNLRELIAQF